MTMSGRWPAAPTSAANSGRKSGHFDRLIDKRAFQPERGRLQREALAGTAYAHPVIGIGAGADKDGDTGGRVELGHIALVLALGRDQAIEEERACPRRQRRSAAGDAEQSIAGPQRVTRIEPQPEFEFADEGGIVHLHRVAG